MSSYGRYAEALGRVNAPVATLFDFLDDQSNLSAHMSKPSGMMLGSTMCIYMDADRTRRVGSKFGFSGHLLGLPLEVAEVVIARDPPISKRWKTAAEPRLWVIGRYEMGVPADARARRHEAARGYKLRPAGGGTPAHARPRVWRHLRPLVHAADGV